MQVHFLMCFKGERASAHEVGSNHRDRLHWAASYH